MGAMQQEKDQQRVELTGIERLNLRVSNMINHPLAQLQRWVTIHRLDTDGDREWEEVMRLLADVGEIDMTFNDDESVTLKWEAQVSDDPNIPAAVEEDGNLWTVNEDAAPF